MFGLILIAVMLFSPDGLLRLDLPPALRSALRRLRPPPPEVRP